MRPITGRALPLSRPAAAISGAMGDKAGPTGVPDPFLRQGAQGSSSGPGQFFSVVYAGVYCEHDI